MKIISRTFHALLDYLSAAVLVIAPWVLEFENQIAATVIAVAAGLVILAMSFITNYEGGKLNVISMGMHLNLDLFLGALLAASPWLLNFSAKVYLPYLIMGILILLSGLLTERRTMNEDVTRYRY
ncbi:MAG: hypothetical protein EOO07_04845 [Chitinophagaceae bacterium]|nr:MAG: hypothetical protein EOO07_04845 [Chitinophagaceae bacterium]